jgi:hypothetical protein
MHALSKSVSAVCPNDRRRLPSTARPLPPRAFRSAGVDEARAEAKAAVGQGSGGEGSGGLGGGGGRSSSGAGDDDGRGTFLDGKIIPSPGSSRSKIELACSERRCRPARYFRMMARRR